MNTKVTEDAILRRPSFWAKQIHICEEKHLEHEIHKERTNPDTQRDHPAECRKHNPEGKILLSCHPEAKVRILKHLAERIKSVTPPPVPHIARYNRS